MFWCEWVILAAYGRLTVCLSPQQCPTRGEGRLSAVLEGKGLAGLCVYHEECDVCVCVCVCVCVYVRISQSERKTHQRMRKIHDLCVCVPIYHWLPLCCVVALFCASTQAPTVTQSCEDLNPPFRLSLCNDSSGAARHICRLSMETYGHGASLKIPKERERHSANGVPPLRFILQSNTEKCRT